MTRNIDMEIERVKAEIELVRSSRQNAFTKHCLKMEEHRTKMSEAKKKFQYALHHGMQSRSPIYQYIEAAKKARGPQHAVPTYVLNMEAKLCRSMHHMLLLETDLNLYHEKSAELFEWMQHELQRIEQEKGDMEVQVMNDIWVAEEETFCLKESSTHRIKFLEEELQQFIQEHFDGKEHHLKVETKNLVSPRYLQRKTLNAPSCATRNPSFFQRLRAAPVS